MKGFIELETLSGAVFTINVNQIITFGPKEDGHGTIIQFNGTDQHRFITVSQSYLSVKLAVEEAL